MTGEAIHGTNKPLHAHSSLRKPTLVVVVVGVGLHLSPRNAMRPGSYSPKVQRVSQTRENAVHCFRMANRMHFHTCKTPPHLSPTQACVRAQQAYERSALLLRGEGSSASLLDPLHVPNKGREHPSTGGDHSPAVLICWQRGAWPLPSFLLSGPHAFP